jgi:hypothetical protein
MQIGRKSTKAAYGLWCAICAYGSMCIVAPTSMAAAFGWTIGIVRPNLDLVVFRLISNPPTDDSGRAGLRY